MDEVRKQLRCLYSFEFFKVLFGREKKAVGKMVKGKIVEGMKVSRKWVES